ncbi:bifunctional acetate--CoA ligase family protein/GNAT family N-acetyltransferase [Hyphomicrobium sp. DY-1]|uniref:bifunctional acetate--CoA ligase family protein/GNAT family N-acetyltransferase n=1 Tax=Hyphomicrobium sp. DY-1 TaxID=3075650 RepID=UPI0039C39BE2
MTVRNLNYLCAPRSVALIGASKRPGSVGATVLKNLLEGGFKGPISLVNPKYRDIVGHRCYSTVADLPEVPDLAVLATPPATITGLIEELSAKGTRATIALAAGMGEQKKAMIAAAQPNCLRILGPNCIGLMVPNIGLNASFAHRAPLAGDLAFVSQSGALVTAVIDWAAGRGIGFSHVVSLGEMADIDLGDMLDYLATAANTRAILLYVEAVTHAPKFISAARRAARMKPVVVIKTGRHAGGAHAALSHTGALAGSDAAYNAAFRRSGILRVLTLDDLFAAAETLSHVPRLGGDRLAILTNGGGAGVLAADELQDWKGTLAVFGPDTIEALNRVLPPTWSRGNPVDIIGDAGTKRYADALEALLHDRDSDAVLVLHCPTATVSATDAAKAVVDTVAAHSELVADKPVMACWLGDGAVREARALFKANKIPTFESTSAAITGFMQLVDHARSQTELMRTPQIAAGDHKYHSRSAGREIRKILESGRTVASALETKTILAAYGIPTDKAVLASDPAAVRSVAAGILKNNDACVIKIASPDISHKSDVGGVHLNLESEAAAEQAAVDMLAKIKAKLPKARIDGFTVEPMVKRPDALETIVGMSVDQTFGPMLLFGAGGVAVEVLRDSAMALPPLDMHLAHQMICETRISRLLKGYRDHAPADMDAIADTLVRISDLIVDHPEIRELDINPLLVDKDGVIAIDARMKLANEDANPRLPLAIRPYPAHLEREISINPVGKVLIRPVRPEDEPAFAKFFSQISEEDVRLRFFTGRKTFPHPFLASLTQIDYAREMAFVAIDAKTNEMIGGSRLVLEPDQTRGEFGILVRSDLHGHGLGWQLMSALLSYAQHEGVEQIYGLVNVANTHMLDMARDLGFETRPYDGDSSIREVVWHPAASALKVPAVQAAQKTPEKTSS